MKVFIGSVFFEKYDQTYPFFIESLLGLTFSDKSVEIADISKTKNLNIAIEKHGFSYTPIPRKDDIGKQVAEVKNHFITMAEEANADYLLILTPDMFLPKNLVEKMLAARQDCVSAAWFMGIGGKMFSNAYRFDKHGKDIRVLPMAMDEVLPSALHEVDACLTDCILISMHSLKDCKFRAARNEIEEAVMFSMELEKPGGKITIDSGNVCSKINAKSVNSFLYYKNLNQENGNNY